MVVRDDLYDLARRVHAVDVDARAADDDIGVHRGEVEPGLEELSGGALGAVRKEEGEPLSPGDVAAGVLVLEGVAEDDAGRAHARVVVDESDFAERARTVVGV